LGGYLSPPAADDSETLDCFSEELRELIFHALAEDLGQGDLTTRISVPGDTQAQGTFGGRIAHSTQGL
jgi:nicotinate-nucleotide pyrophosphorylase